MDREDISIEQREARLWDATRRYSRGEISAEELGTIANIRLEDLENDEMFQKTRRIRLYLGFTIVVIFTAWFALGLVDVLFSGNWGLLVVALLSLLPLYYILSRYFFDRETQKATGS